MHLETILLMGIAVNLDNFCIGMSYGLAKKSISLYSNLLIGFISGMEAYIACACMQMLPKSFSAAASIIGSVLLIGLGIWSITSCLCGKGKKDDTADFAAKPIGLIEMCILGFVLALNALTVSFGMGLTGVPALGLGISIAVFSFIAVGLGNYMGKKAIFLYCQRKLDIISGLLLIVIGIWEWFI